MHDHTTLDDLMHVKRFLLSHVAAEQAAAKRSQNINAQPAANNSSRISDPYLANAA